MKIFLGILIGLGAYYFASLGESRFKVCNKENGCSYLSIDTTNGQIVSYTENGDMVTWYKCDGNFKVKNFIWQDLK